MHVVKLLKNKFLYDICIIKYKAIEIQDYTSHARLIQNKFIVIIQF